jgi:diguanylate cyclase (GGDEF)-like protein
VEKSRLDQPIPKRALFLAVLGLLVPVVSVVSGAGPGQGADALLWFSALIPAFVLSYYRGWRGSAVAMATGMVALSATNLAIVTLGLASPDWHILSAVVIAYVALAMGIGRLSDRLHRERVEAEVRAMTDSMTGLTNRRLAERMLEQATAQAVRGTPLTVVIFDVDHFKDFNDTYGHAAGDEVLRRIGGILASAARKSDLASRYGGEEFLCLLNHCSSGGALAFIERVRNALARAELPGDGVTLSAGVADWQRGMVDYHDLVAAADRALYAAKADGRDCTRVAGPPEALGGSPTATAAALSGSE